MPLWIPITIAAAFLQNMRSTLQKQLSGAMSAYGATYVRFSFGLPVAALYLAGILWFTGASLPMPNMATMAYAAVGGLAQIVATVLLVALFAYRNFAVGTAYSKTETVQTAIFGIVVLGDHLTVGASLAILVSLFGVLMISMAKSDLPLVRFWRSLGEKPALMGIASGALYGISAVSYRAGALSLGLEGFVLPAAFMLLVVLAIQTATMTVWLWIYRRNDLKAAFRLWPQSAAVGLVGALGSIGWFSAMTLQNAAYVRALGQIELVFTFITSHIVFREKTSRLEFLGIVLVVGGLLLLVLGR
ncbi:EamA family transporter [Parvibaculum sp. MBR-TMA-1.3b-4.2]|jgi:drug/metabolite transporter (DMT)-like permease